MSLSWNFPVRASPSYEGSEPSRARALQFSSWNVFKNYNQISKFSTSIMIVTNLINCKIISMILYKTKGVLGSWKLWFSYINEFFLLKIKISARFGQFLISSWREKGHEPSWAELKILQLELWLEPTRLGLITSHYYIRVLYSSQSNTNETLWGRKAW